MNDKSPTYSSYLKIGDLISLQKPLTDHHDEMLFIIVHQSYELWFKQILWEMDSLVINMVEGDKITSYRRLGRILEILNTLVSMISILETMTPVEFNRFRSALQVSSGFQSFQFRELELMSGAEAGDYEKFFDLEPEWKERLQKRAQKTNLREAFLQVLEKYKGLEDRSHESLMKTLMKVYRDDTENLDLLNLCEHLIRYDETLLTWRFRHVQMVERMIGMKMGTGQSMGVKYLQSTLNKKFFPELWEARTHMNGGSGSSY